jgi:hypothetical protein
MNLLDLTFDDFYDNYLHQNLGRKNPVTDGLPVIRNNGFLGNSDQFP